MKHLTIMVCAIFPIALSLGCETDGDIMQEAQGICSSVDSYCDPDEDFALITCENGAAMAPQECGDGLACYHTSTTTAECVTPNTCTVSCYVTDENNNAQKYVSCTTTTDEASLLLVQSQSECTAYAKAKCEAPGSISQTGTLDDVTGEFAAGELCETTAIRIIDLGVCEPGTVKCASEQYSTCDEDGGWSDAMDCPEGQQCLLENGVEGCQ